MDETSDRTAATAEDPARWGRKVLEANRQGDTRHTHTPPVRWTEETRIRYALTAAHGNG